MPKTLIKKRIKKQNTRKNNIRGGILRGIKAATKSIADSRPALVTGTKLMAAADTRDEEPFVNEITLKNIYKIFEVNENTGIPIPNYSKYTHFKVLTPIKIFIDMKDRVKDPRIRCIHGIHTISEFIIHPSDKPSKIKKGFILIKNDVQGHSAIFKSSNFTCRYEGPEK